jgi:hypothetical protein
MENGALGIMPSGRERIRPVGTRIAGSDPLVHRPRFEKATTIMSNPTETMKVALPLAASATAQTVVNVCTSQSAVIKQCPAYPNTPAVEAAVADMDTAVAALSGTVTKIDQTHALLATLVTTRGTQLGTVYLKHEGVETALNTASNGDPVAAQAWTGKTKTRAAPAPVSATTTPPENAALEVIKSSPGSVKASCTPEDGAVGYLFQQGGDPLHPETWAPGSVTRGHTFKVHNQPIGQIVYFRIAIVRRGSIQSQWSPIVQIVVR